MKKPLALVLVLVLALPALVSASEIAPVKIGVMLYDTEGQSMATQTYLNQLSAHIPGLEFVFGAAASMDADANLSTCEGMIAQGCNGIITTVTTGMLNMAQACEEQGVFIATYLVKPDEAEAEEIAQLSSFLGGVTDGPLTGEERGVAAAEFIIENGFKKVGTASFPLSVMVGHNEAYGAFVETIDAYNAGAADAEKITLEENEELFFSPLDTSYFANHPDIDCLYSLAAGINFAYPPMVQAGVNGKIKLVTQGMRYDEDSYAAITSGDIAMTSFTSMEQAFYPVALIFNAVNGMSYPDGPEGDGVVPCSMIYLRGAEDMAKLQEKSYYFRASDDETDRLLLTPEQAQQLLLPYNADATYAELTAFLDNLSLEDFQ